MSQSGPSPDPIHASRLGRLGQAGPLRALLGGLPTPVRVWLRRILKGVYWVLTPHRMPQRIAFLREQKALADAYRGAGRPPPPPKVEDLATAKASFRRARLKELETFLAGGTRLRLPASDAPKVSIILILYNQAELTLHCLRSLLTPEVETEVIILDNGSSDRTGELLDRLDGATVIRSPENLHFLRGVNRAALDARGEAILLLNNDTWVEPGSIEAAWERLAEDPTVGAVGGRIVLPNGTLQEAGSIIWRDGACLGYGRGRDPDDPEFGFRREVDYCSGAFLMVRRSAWTALGGFDERFAPAYYEETDLCMRLRAHGLRVLYEPKVRLTHFEFGSAGASTAIALQERNRALFVERHAEALEAGYPAHGISLLEARMRDHGRGRLLIVDDRPPVGSLGAGLPRAADIVAGARAAGWFVSLYPLQFPQHDPEGQASAGPEVEILYGGGMLHLPRILEERAGYYDAVLVSRPHNMELFRRAYAVAPNFARATRVIYDAEAMFSKREALKRRVLGEPAEPDEDSREAAGELALAAGVDLVLSVSETEAAVFRAGLSAEVRVLGHAIQADPTPAGFEPRHGLLFVGALDEPDSPNTDSLVWFAHEVMPRLDALVGTDWTLTVAGRCEGARDLDLGPRVRLLGRVDELRPLYDGARAFIAPTRFAAGLPMKVHEAAGAGLPCVVTPLLAAQLGWSDGEAVLVGDGAEAFAQACARLMSDPRLWQDIRDGALAAVRRDCDPAQFRRTLADLLAPFERVGPGETP